MGQLYRAYLESESGEKSVYSGDKRTKYLFLKLMAHSWVGNYFVDSIAGLIHKRPMRVAWVGQYADSVEAERIDEIYPIVWEEEHAQWIKKKLLTLYGRYFVNHSKKIYFDFDAYAERSRRCGEFDEEIIVHPLPLLTAVGNGMGSGDYRGVNQKDVGSWYLDLISIEDEIPEDYEPVEYTFYEDLKIEYIS